MKIHFKKLDYQTQAVGSVVKCFHGQPKQKLSYINNPTSDLLGYASYVNHPFTIEKQQILKNIQQVQKQNNLSVSNQLDTNDDKNKNLTNSSVNISVEMETGTGKTYVFIRTIFELHKQYGWGKFIIVVPSIAIREGIYKSLQMTADHLMQDYNQKAKYFIYNSSQFNNIKDFSSDNNINIMIINIQAFNSKSENNRRIYSPLDQCQSEKPIDIIKHTNPILILDEPQKMAAEKTLQSLANFNPLFILRFSATHKHAYNLVYKLDAIDSFNQKLVKKILVKGIEIEQGLQGKYGYLYLQNIILSTKQPQAKLEIEIKTKSGYKRVIRQVKKSDNLYLLSGNLPQYKDRYIITEINEHSCYFSNGLKVSICKSIGAPDECITRKIQIRETIKAHIAKEKMLYQQGIKVLSLFFIDEVAKYRQYDDKNNIIPGEYVKIFEEQYKNIIDSELKNLPKDSSYEKYKKYLNSIDINKTHKGYFSIDKKNRMINSNTKVGTEEAQENKSYNLANDYNLILKDKEKLLSFAEPTRFIFSHSALKEGWDNPNVFVICPLKKSNNTISRRQEIGRGLRLAVNQDGQRMDSNYFNGSLKQIHTINTLNVIVDESYAEFAQGLQTEILATISRPKTITAELFKDIMPNARLIRLIFGYLEKHKYIDKDDQLTGEFASSQEDLPPLPKELQPFKEKIFAILKSCVNPSMINKMITNADDKILNEVNKDNSQKKEFEALWHRINKVATFEINIDTNELINTCIKEINQAKFDDKLQYKLESAVMKDDIQYDDLQDNSTIFTGNQTSREKFQLSSSGHTKFDLLGEIARETYLTRQTIARILTKLENHIFAQYKLNPENFIREISKIINQQKDELVLPKLKYIFLDKELDFNKIFITDYIDKHATHTVDAKKSIYKFISFDSQIEEDFAQELEKATEVIVYTKLPQIFKIPTPFGGYNPDWAIAFDKDKIKYIYFVVETKGSSAENALRPDEKNKIDSAKKYFENTDIKYKLVKSCQELFNLLERTCC